MCVCVWCGDPVSRSIFCLPESNFSEKSLGINFHRYRFHTVRPNIDLVNDEMWITLAMTSNVVRWKFSWSARLTESLHKARAGKALLRSFRRAQVKRNSVNRSLYNSVYFLALVSFCLNKTTIDKKYLTLWLLKAFNCKSESWV